MPRILSVTNELDIAPSVEAIKRISTDIREVLMSNNPLIHIFPDEDDVTHLEALIIGPSHTPYADGFFHFDLVFPIDYPWKPPRVQLMTTDNGRVSFNPNLYANGKVCLSILGTWEGPGWTQVQTLNSVLLSIQSLMNPLPYFNEPGYEHTKPPEEVLIIYNEKISYHTLKVAEVMDDWFMIHYEDYVERCSVASVSAYGAEPSAYEVVMQSLHRIKGEVTLRTIEPELHLEEVSLRCDTELPRPEIDLDPILLNDEQLALSLHEEELDNSRYRVAYRLTDPSPNRDSPSRRIKMSLSEILNTSSDSVHASSFTSDVYSCLCCRSISERYVILPACKSTHTLCPSCAERMLVSDVEDVSSKTRREPTRKTEGLYLTITCPLCRSVSHVSERHKLRPLYNDGGAGDHMCDEHREEFCMFCLDCASPVCFTCMKKHHLTHDCEPLDIAPSRIRSTIVPRWRRTLEQKQDETKRAQAIMQERQIHVKDSKKAAESSLREQFKELRRYLDEKEKIILAGMEEAEKSSEDKIEREMSRLQKKSKEMDGILRTIDDLDGDGTELLRKTERCDWNMTECLHDPAGFNSRPDMFKVPHMSLATVVDAVKFLKYPPDYQFRGSFSGAVYNAGTE
ncbi:hypothetical protein PROFUN_03952 [Planoprotostelium fungivorum]|uniref:Ubiquitin-conjugating enzyme E2 Z n=1 Tax=Planoprotostelium fungivorum TaxID=1890364 RepID=A0A2P6MTX8_9EUKA|nr:hypothetical protein PROFUN_03952 [Planoprotostelium fungivorum]